MSPVQAGGGRIAPSAAKGGATKKPTAIASRQNFACLLFGGGAQYDISEFVTSATWTDSFDAPAQELDLELADPRVDDPNSDNPSKSIPLRQLIKVGMGIRCFADHYNPDGSVVPLSRNANGTYKTEFYRGYIFGKSIDASPAQDMVQLTCYDELIYLAKNDLDVVFKKVTATEVIRQLCDSAGLKMADPGQNFQDTAVRISRLVSYGNSLYDVAYLALQKTWMLTGGQADGTGGKRYRLRSEVGNVTLRERLSPKSTWVLRPNDVTKNGQVIPGNIISATHSVSIENLLTGFDIRHTGTDGRRQFGGSYFDPKMEQLYGRMRKTVDVPKFDAADIKKVMAQQKALIGIPEQQISVAIPLLNAIRAGDVVLLQESVDTNITGKWYVSAVSHSLTSSDAASTLTLVKTIIEADVIDKSSVEAPLETTTASVSYSRVKGDDGKDVKYSGRAKVVDLTGIPLGTDGPGTSIGSGSEPVVIINKSINVKVGSYMNIYSGTHYRRVQVVSTMNDDKYDVYVAKTVADEINIDTGDKVDMFPLTVKKPASASSSASDATSGSYDGALVADINTVAKRYGADAAVMVATSMLESGLKYQAAVGDNGTSFGPFQMHEGGALGSHTRAWAESNDTGPGGMLANRAQAFARAGARDGAGAAAVQGPANPGSYAVIVDKNLPQARALLNQFT